MSTSVKLFKMHIKNFVLYINLKFPYRWSVHFWVEYQKISIEFLEQCFWLTFMLLEKANNGHVMKILLTQTKLFFTFSLISTSYFNAFVFKTRFGGCP